MFFSKIIFDALLSWSEKKSADAKTKHDKETWEGWQASERTFHLRVLTEPRDHELHLWRLQETQGSEARGSPTVGHSVGESYRKLRPQTKV